MSPALIGGFFTTEPPGKPCSVSPDALSVVLGTEWNQRLRAGVGEAAGPRCHHQRLAFLFSHNKSRLLTAQEHTRVC